MSCVDPREPIDGPRYVEAVRGARAMRYTDWRSCLWSQRITAHESEREHGIPEGWITRPPKVLRASD